MGYYEVREKGLATADAPGPLNSRKHAHTHEG